MKPSREVQFASGITERYDLVVPSNFDIYFRRVGPEEFQALVAQQPALPAFPFCPLDDDFSFGEVFSSVQPGIRNVVIYSANVQVRSPLRATTLSVYGQEVFVSRIEGGIGFAADFVTLAGNPRAVGGMVRSEAVRNGTEFRSTVPRETDIALGMDLFIFQGSDGLTSKVSGAYAAAANQLRTGLRKQEVPSAANGGRQGVAVNLYPAMDEPDGWVHTDDGRIAVVSGK